MDHIPFGVGFAPNVGAPNVIEAAQLAERLGYDVFWVTDSHLASREAMAMLGALAVSTDRIHLGTGVSHLAGRHPSVIASAMATLDELAPGRIRLGIGVGDSGPTNLGVPRSTLRELEAAVIGIRALLEGRAIDGPTSPKQLGDGPTSSKQPSDGPTSPKQPSDGPTSPKQLSLGYVKPRDNPVPIYISGSAERTHRLTGRVADGALISGMPNELRASIESVHAGEREAGRPAGSTRIMLWTTVAVDDDREAARAAVRGSVARRALNYFARLSRQGQLDPDDQHALERLRREHDHAHLWEPEFADLVPERWIDRFAIAGTPAEVRVRLEQAVQDGAQEISLILIAPRTTVRGSADQLSHFAHTVMSPLRGREA
jgi:5,10-methylenetetrahydromethanopterin reductase